MDIVFADENARIAWEIGESIKKIIPTIPFENQNLEALPIAFEREGIIRGRYAILMAGTVIGTPYEGIYLVPKRTRDILEILNIPFTIVEIR